MKRRFINTSTSNFKLFGTIQLRLNRMAMKYPGSNFAVRYIRWFLVTTFLFTEFHMFLYFGKLQKNIAESRKQSRSIRYFLSITNLPLTHVSPYQ